jgi:hypothetical protein
MADMGWSQYIRRLDDAAAMEEKAREQDMLPWFYKFCDYESPHEMYRVFYKYTDCGPWVSLHVNGQRVHCQDLHKLGLWKDMVARGDIVDEMLIGRIVEGVDAEAAPVSVRLGDIRSSRSKSGKVTRHSLRSALDSAVSAVNKDAQAIWNETHGCDTCRKHWADEGCVDASGDALVSVWDECPDCGGHGAII